MTVKGDDMKATRITYSRLVKLHDYQNERMEVEVEVDDGEDPKDAARKAKLFVHRQLGLMPERNDERVEMAQQLVAAALEDDIPF